MSDTLPKIADKPKLVPSWHYVRYGGRARFRETDSSAALMFDLGDDYTAEIAACTDAEGMALAFGMLQAISSAKDPRGPLWCVYIMEAEGSGFCKIGVSANPVERVAKIQTANPHKVRLYACVFSAIVKATEIEGGILRKAAEEGWRAQGEWVRATPEHLLTEIFNFAKRECHAICDPRTWFETMRDVTLRKASRSPRYRDRF